MTHIFTIGHSYISSVEFTGLLLTQHIEVVVDVRSMPGSRRSPQFNKEEMEDWCAGYMHLPDLGGRRRTKDVDSSVNAGWENPSFKSYADYTLTKDFWRGFNELTELASRKNTAIMCGEPMPWRCHRSIISNNLVAYGNSVSHIMPDEKLVEHTLGLYGASPVLHNNGTLTYPIGA